MRHLVLASLVIFATERTTLAQHPYQGVDGGPTRGTENLRGPAAAGVSGRDPCLAWNLKDDDLKNCRQRWMDAKTPAEQTAVRNEYSARAPAREDDSREAKVADPNASGPCDTLKLAAADLSQCRAQWKSTHTDQEREQVIARYRSISAGDRSVSRTGPDSTQR